MKCEKCDAIIVAGDERDYQGQTSCEDCYIESRNPIHFNDVFVRPMVQEEKAEVWIEVNNFHEEYKNVKFYVIEFDARYSRVLRNHELASEFISLPYTFYFKNGKAVKATESIQNKKQVKTIIEEHLV